MTHLIQKINIITGNKYAINLLWSIKTTSKNNHKNHIQAVKSKNIIILRKMFILF